VAAFATYSALVYGRRSIVAVVAAVLVGLAHVVAGPHWPSDLTGGALLGGALGLAAYALTVRAVPGGHVATRRAGRSAREAHAGPGSP
jgi:membrane-associated phospholipid phosphatase